MLYVDCHSDIIKTTLYAVRLRRTASEPGSELPILETNVAPAGVRPLQEDGRPSAHPPLTTNQHKITDNLYQLLDVLPPRLRACLEREDSLDDLLEIVLDLGRPSEARLPGRVVELVPDR